MPSLHHPGYTMVYILPTLVYHVLHSVSAVSGKGALGSEEERRAGYEAHIALPAPKV